MTIELRWLCSKRNDWERLLQYAEMVNIAGRPKKVWRNVPEVIETESTDSQREAYSGPSDTCPQAPGRTEADPQPAQAGRGEK